MWERRGETRFLIKSSERGAVKPEGVSETYTVVYKGKNVLSGFEHTFSDRSTWIYTHDLRDGDARMTFVDRNGNPIGEHPTKNMDLDLKQVIEMAAKQEQAHKQWRTGHSSIQKGRGQTQPIARLSKTGVLRDENLQH